MKEGGRMEVRKYGGVVCKIGGGEGFYGLSLGMVCAGRRRRKERFSVVCKMRY